MPQRQSTTAAQAITYYDNLGNFQSIPIEIIEKIFSHIDYYNTKGLLLVCRLFQALGQPFLQQIIVHFSKEKKPSLCSTFLYNDYKRLLHPFLIPQLLLIEPNQPEQLKKSNLFIYSLFMDCYDGFPSSLDISKVRLLVLSDQNISINLGNLIGDFIQSHQFLNLNTLVLYRISIDEPLVKHCSKNLNLKSLIINFCNWEYVFGQKPISLNSFTSLKELDIIFNCTYVRFDLPNELEKLDLKFYVDPWKPEACVRLTEIYAANCVSLKSM